MKLNVPLYVFSLLFFLSLSIFNHPLNGTVLKYHPKDGLLNTFNRCYLMDSENRVWIGTFGSGIRVNDGKKWKVYTRENTAKNQRGHQGLLSDYILAMAMDSARGNLYVITDKGVCRFNIEKGEWLNFTEKLKPPVEYVKDVACDDDGNAYFATYAGVAVYNDETGWALHTKKQGLFDENIRVVRYSNGSVWAGSRAGAICRFDGEKWTTYVDY